MSIDPLLARTSPDIDVEALYRQHRARLCALAASITLDRQVADDVVHDAFAGLQRTAATVHNPLGYLQRAVVNGSISVIRRRQRLRRTSVGRLTVTVNPEVDETWGLVARLPARERAVVVLRYGEDLSEAQTAELLGWPAGTVKSTLARALARLRKEISE